MRKQKNSFLTGDLIYLPSGVTLYKFTQHDLSALKEAVSPPSEIKKLSKPTSALIVETCAERNPYYKILCNGDYWHVHYRFVFSGGKNDS